MRVLARAGGSLLVAVVRGPIGRGPRSRAYIWEWIEEMSAQFELLDRVPIQHNVFFASQPAAAASVRIVRLAQDVVGHRCLGARLLPPERLHVSVLAIGGFVDPLPSALIDEVKAIAGTVPMAPFDVVFDRVASFNGGHGKSALVLTGHEGVAGLVVLQEALILALSKAGVRVRPTKPFKPHVTMAYADRTSEFSIEPISWTVNEFVLVDSLVGLSRHILLGRWAL